MQKKLLLVDDSSFIRMVMKKALQGENIVIFEANNGKDALSLYEEHQPDLVTLDIIMPGENGLDLLVKIKKTYPEAKVIMCSSMIYRENIQEALEKGAAGFLVKPFRDEAFLEMIRKNM